MYADIGLWGPVYHHTEAHYPNPLHCGPSWLSNRVYLYTYHGMSSYWQLWRSRYFRRPHRFFPHSLAHVYVTSLWWEAWPALHVRLSLCLQAGRELRSQFVLSRVSAKRKSVIEWDSTSEDGNGMEQSGLVGSIDELLKSRNWWQSYTVSPYPLNK